MQFGGNEDVWLFSWLELNEFETEWLEYEDVLLLKFDWMLLTQFIERFVEETGVVDIVRLDNGIDVCIVVIVDVIGVDNEDGNDDCACNNDIDGTDDLVEDNKFEVEVKAKVDDIVDVNFKFDADADDDTDNDVIVVVVVTVELIEAEPDLNCDLKKGPFSFR